MMITPLRKYSMLILFTIISQVAWAQCQTWLDSPRKSEAEDAHTVYRQSITDGDWLTAFEYWQIAFEIAPAADGKRDFHYLDGVKIYKNKLKNDPEAKEEILKTIDMLYKGAADCYEAGIIQVHKCTGDECGIVKAGKVLGRYGYDMVYELSSPLTKSFEVFKSSLEKAGNGSEYVVLNPYAHVAVNLYKREKITAEEARRIHEQLNAVADYNIENNEKYGELDKSYI